MTCRYHTNEDGDQKYYLTPFSPCPSVILTTDGTLNCCPCDGCDGVLELEGRNVLDTLSFWGCNECGHATVANDIKDSHIGENCSDK